LQPAAAPPPIGADRIAQTPALARDNGPTARAVEQPAVTDRVAKTDQAAAEPAAPAVAPPLETAAPPPAPAAAAGVADESRRARTVEVRPDIAAPEPSTRAARKAAPLQPPAEDRVAALAKAAEQNLSSPQFLGSRAAPGASSYAPAAPSRSAAGLADAPPGFAWPVRGRVIAGFGSPVGGAANKGIDLAVAAGTDIHAAGDGVVLYAGNEIKDLGNLLLLRHRDGFLTAYAHVQSFAVKPGDTVRRGQVIAKAGQTGAVASPQLHFEIRKDDRPVDPAQYLPPPG
jgi:murein DD-endopeptidase MepM/ murein hydrolase activator NlpD